MDQITTRPSTPLAKGAALVWDLINKYLGSEFLTTERAHLSAGLIIGTEGVHGVLVSRFQLGVHLGLAFEIHLAEHVQRRLLTRTRASSSRLFQGASKLPSVLIALEAEWLAILYKSC